MRLLVHIDGEDDFILSPHGTRMWHCERKPHYVRVRDLGNNAYIVEGFHEGQVMFRRGLMGFDQLQSAEVAFQADGVSGTVTAIEGDYDELAPEGQAARGDVCLACPEYRHPGCGIMRCCADGSVNAERWFMNLRHPQGTCPLRKWPV